MCLLCEGEIYDWWIKWPKNGVTMMIANVLMAFSYTSCRITSNNASSVACRIRVLLVWHSFVMSVGELSEMGWSFCFHGNIYEQSAIHCDVYFCDIQIIYIILVWVGDSNLYPSFPSSMRDIDNHFVHGDVHGQWCKEMFRCAREIWETIWKVPNEATTAGAHLYKDDWNFWWNTTCM